MKILITSFYNSPNIYVKSIADALMKMENVEVLCSIDAFWNTNIHFDIIHIQWPEEVLFWKSPTVELLKNLKEKILYWKNKSSKIVVTRHNNLTHNSEELSESLYKMVYGFANAVIHLGKKCSISFAKSKNKIFKIKHKEKGPIRVNADIIFSNTTFKKTDVETYPMIVPNWDNTPRSGRRGVVMENTSPELFSKEVKKAKKFLDNSHNKENFLIIKSWNEWAEGNYLEPDMEHRFGFLEMIKKYLK